MGATLETNSPVEISAAQARLFLRRALLLDDPMANVGAALEHHGYIQLDPVNVCGRMHDLILRNRVTNYHEGDLMRHVHGDAQPLKPEQREAFEHHLPSTSILAAFPVSAWPYMLSAMQARTRRSGAWSGRLTPREKELAVRILEEIGTRGPLSSEDIDDARRGRKVWGSSSLAKSTLQKLFFHGRVLIAGRQNHRRLYDLPERVLPAEVLRVKEPPPHETAEWLVLTKLRQRRLVILKRDELAIAAPFVELVKIPDCPPVFCLRQDRALLESAAVGDVDPRPRLLAPLDPLIYDRRLTEHLWNFSYTWEAYTPAHKRVRGHYALPVLAALELVGHVDPKADRKQCRLRVVSKYVRRGYSIAAAKKELAQFLGLRG